jgi:hypothetical protein
MAGTSDQDAGAGKKKLGHLPADVRREIVCENAGKFYGFPLSAT